MANWTWNEQLAAFNKLTEQLKPVFGDLPPARFNLILDEHLVKAGLDPHAIRSRIAKEADVSKQEYRERVFRAAAIFKAAHPETDPVNGFLQNEANERTLFEWLSQNELDGTSPTHFEEAFASCRERLAMPERKRMAARVEVIGGVEISHESLDRLSARQLEALLQNPRAVEAVNALPPRNR